MKIPTIVALATPNGRSGIGVVRLSGSGALEIVRLLCPEATLEPRRATLLELLDPTDKELIDTAVVTYFKAPASFTGEDVIEIACHGSPVILRRVIDVCLGADCRLAEPGEFTLRALANGKLDLTEAEAIRDLIEAQTAASARHAVRQMHGEFSHTLKPIKDDLLDVIVVLESALEFVEDDLPETQTQGLIDRLKVISVAASRIADTYKAGKLIRDGLRVAIVGRPNVGKSSLFNALLGSERAIVTDIAGTTRDQIHERFVVNDIPVSLIDTAGLRETIDTVEKIGVERSRQTMSDADLVIVVIDGSEPAAAEDEQILASVKDIEHLVAVNKIDKFERDAPRPIAAYDGPQVEISAKTGEGLERLKGSIVGPFAPNDLSQNGFLISDARHRDLLVRAADEIERSALLLADGTSEELVLVGLHNAIRYLGQITGETTTEDMLTRIFATFCIGK